MTFTLEAKGDDFDGVFTCPGYATEKRAKQHGNEMAEGCEDVHHNFITITDADGHMVAYRSSRKGSMWVNC